MAQHGNTYHVYWQLVTPEGEQWTHADYAGSFRELIEIGKASLAYVVAQDSTKDLAILNVEDLPDWMDTLTLATDGPYYGDIVHFVGHPSDRPLFTYGIGLVESIEHRSWTYSNVGQYVDAEVVDCRAQGYSRFSGSPVVGSDGHLLGVLSGASMTHVTVIHKDEVAALESSIEYAQAFRIRNDTQFSVNFSIRWNSAGDWEFNELKPGWSWTL